MKMKESYFLYSDHNIIVEDDDMLSWIHYLCSKDVSFFIIVDRSTNKAYKIVTTIDDAEKACHKYNKQMQTNTFIYDFIDNSRKQK